MAVRAITKYVQNHFPAQVENFLEIFCILVECFAANLKTKLRKVKFIYLFFCSFIYLFLNLHLNLESF